MDLQVLSLTRTASETGSHERSISFASGRSGGLIANRRRASFFSCWRRDFLIKERTWLILWRLSFCGGPVVITNEESWMFPVIASVKLQCVQVPQNYLHLLSEHHLRRQSVDRVETTIQDPEVMTLKADR